MIKTNVWYNEIGDNMKIKQIKKVGMGKYHLILEDGSKIITYDEVILKYNLLYKKEIDSSLVDCLLNESSYYDVYNKVIKYISIRLRSESEIKKYLEKYQLSEQNTNSLIKKLKESGFVNDQNFVKAFISDKVHLSTMGPYKIKLELLKHHIDEDIIDQELDHIDEELIFDKLYKMVLKKIKSNKKYSSYMLRQKLLVHFRDLGYDHEMIDTCIREASIGDTSILEHEIEKLYKKLSRKYQGKELIQKTKEKCYQKGFEISKINLLLEEYIQKKES